MEEPTSTAPNVTDALNRLGSIVGSVIDVLWMIIHVNSLKSGQKIFLSSK